MIKQFFLFALISISTSLAGAQQAQEEQKVEEVKLPGDHTASHALHGIIDNNLPTDVVQLIGKFMGGYTKINILKHGGFMRRAFLDYCPLINSVGLTSDGEFFASASHDKTIKVWNSNTGSCIKTFKGHDEEINSIHWSTGKLLASASDDQTVKIWAPFLGSCLLTLVGHTQGVNEVRWSPPGTQLASCSNDSTVRVWDAESGNCLQVLDHEGKVRSVSWLSDNELITTCNNKIIKWNTGTSECISVFEDPDEIVYTAQASPEGNFIASSSKAVRVLQASSGECLQVLQEKRPIHWLSENLITTRLSSDSRRIKILYALTGESIATLGGEFYITYEKEGTVSSVGDAVSRRSVPVTHYVNGSFSSIDSSSLTGRLAAGCSYGRISIWDPASKYLAELCTSERRKKLQTKCVIQ